MAAALVLCAAVSVRAGNVPLHAFRPIETDPHALQSLVTSPPRSRLTAGESRKNLFPDRY
jgi:hypothetical protein